MPYVTKNHRNNVEFHLRVIHEYILMQPDYKRDGILNYVVSELVGRTMKPDNGWSYHYLHRAYGVFAAAGAEFYRRVVSVYEDKAIANNGDIDAYQNG